MNPQPLDTRLRRLRLGFMAQSFEAQNAESLKAKHSFMEFFEALVDGELSADDIEALIEKRNAARAAKDFATADAVRDQLAAAGIKIEDGPDGTSWRRSD